MDEEPERTGRIEAWLDGIGLERAWLAVTGGLVAAIAVGSVLFTRTVYAEFVWHYFWGPVYADAHGWSCAAWANGRIVEPADCGAVAPGMGPVAEPGYTLVSEVGYVVVLLLMLVGVGLLLRRLDVHQYRSGWYALFPFVLFGGALRVVEDANTINQFEAQLHGIEPTSQAFLSYPANTLLISPLIYFTVFFLTLGALLVAIRVQRAGAVDTDRLDAYYDRIDPRADPEGYELPLAAIGTVLFVATIGFLVTLAVTKPYVEFHWTILAVVVVLSLAATAGTWWLVGEYAPDVNRGTGRMGVLIILGQAVDGVANVVGLDWADELGLRYDLSPKHPVNRAVVEATQAILPQSVIGVTGDAWPFLLVKLVAAVIFVSIFDREVMEDSPRFTVMLLVAVLAIGLGPGTRDALRATFGV